MTLRHQSAISTRERRIEEARLAALFARPMTYGSWVLGTDGPRTGQDGGPPGETVWEHRDPGLSPA
jgi:hypothetical protein